MLQRRVWDCWTTSAPITLLLFSWTVEPFLEHPGEKVKSMLTTGFMLFNYQGLSNQYSVSGTDLETTEESAEVVFMGMYFFWFIALYLDWLTGSGISKTIYVTV